MPAPGGGRDTLLESLRAAQAVVKSRVLSTSGPSAASLRRRAASSTDEEHPRQPRARTEEAETAEPKSTLNASDDLKGFLAHYYSLLCEFAQDITVRTLPLPVELTPYDRHVLHELAQRCGFSHEARGEGDKRQLLILKDALFYASPDTYKTVDLDALSENKKESKYELRRVHGPRPGAVPAGQVGSYADEDAARRLDRLAWATDEYRHAKHIGYSQDELADGEGIGSTRLEALLRGDASEDGGGAPTAAGPYRLNAVPTAVVASTAGGPSTAGAEPVARATAPRPRAERCKGCGTRAKVTYDLGRWQCSHYCAQCARTTIWVLEDQAPGTDADTGLVETPPHSDGEGQTNAERATQSSRRRRHRDESDAKDANSAAERYGSTVPLPLERSDDEDADDVSGGAEALTVDDIAENAAAQDYSREDAAWIREFAQQHAARLGDRFAFCMDFHSLLKDREPFRCHDVDAAATTSSDEAPAKRRRTTPGGDSDAARPCLYLVLRQVGTQAGQLVAVTALIDRAVAAAVEDADAGETAAESLAERQLLRAAAVKASRLAVALPDVSVFEAEATAICQLRGFTGAADAAHHRRLMDLQKLYGTRHVFFTHSLAEAVRHTTTD